MNPLDIAWTALPCTSGQLFEGARWLPSVRQFQWVDILAATIHRWTPGDGKVETRELNLEFTTVAIPLDGDRSLVASRDSLHEYSWSSGRLARRGQWRFDDDVRFNDGARSPDGNIFIGTMSMERRSNAGSLYRYDAGELRAIVSGVGISNGIGWISPTRALYIDSLIPRIHTADLTSVDVELSTYVPLSATDEPDGLCVTPDGGALIANWGKAQLIHIAPDGQRLGDIDVPVLYPTSVALGGVDLDLLLVTSALDEATESTQSPGRVFVGRYQVRR